MQTLLWVSKKRDAAFYWVFIFHLTEDFILELCNRDLTRLLAFLEYKTSC